MRTFFFGKIIRDKIVQAMESEGCVVEYRSLVGEERVQKLIEKLSEESEELASVRSGDDLLEELADAQLVIDALLGGLSDVDMQRFEKLHRVKLKEKGGFNNAIWVDTVSVPEDNEWIAYFESKPDKYPEQR